MSHDIVPENNVQEIEIEGPQQDGCSIASRQNVSGAKSVNSDPKSKKNLIEGVECSVRSDDRFTVRFVNTTDKSVDVIWLNFEGQPVTYKTLQPQTAWSVFTYKVCEQALVGSSKNICNIFPPYNSYLYVVFIAVISDTSMDIS